MTDETRKQRCPQCGATEPNDHRYRELGFLGIGQWRHIGGIMYQCDAPFHSSAPVGTTAGTTPSDVFTKLQVAERFIEKARKHFEDPETTRCEECTKALFEFDALYARPLEEIRAELRKRQQ